MTPQAELAAQASLVQDLWLGGDPRLRGRRLAPFEPAGKRLVFLPTLGASLDEEPLARYLESLAQQADVVAFEPRGQGCSAGRLGSGQVEDLRRLIEASEHWWPDGLPLCLVGHGLGASLALAAASHPSVRSVVALAPWLKSMDPPDEAFEAVRARVRGHPTLEAVRELLEELQIAEAVRDLSVPCLLVDARDDGFGDHDAIQALGQAQPHVAFVGIPGDPLTPLTPQWANIVNAWAAGAVSTPSLSGS
jgi:pimeloyl-ACP methyl ester carboxylesterase